MHEVHEPYDEEMWDDVIEREIVGMEAPVILSPYAEELRSDIERGDADAASVEVEFQQGELSRRERDELIALFKQDDSSEPERIDRRLPVPSA